MQSFLHSSVHSPDLLLNACTHLTVHPFFHVRCHLFSHSRLQMHFSIIHAFLPSFIQQSMKSFTYSHTHIISHSCTHLPRPVPCSCLQRVVLSANLTSLRNFKADMHYSLPCVAQQTLVTDTLLFADSSMHRPGSPALQPGRRLSSYGRPATALSRLAKLAKTSPGISPRLALPAQAPQYVARADPPHASADPGRAPLEDSSNATHVKARGTLYTGLAQDAAQHVENETHFMSQQAQQRQQQGAIPGAVDQNAAVCNAELVDASRHSQAGVPMLFHEATLRACIYAEHA